MTEYNAPYDLDVFNRTMIALAASAALTSCGDDIAEFMVDDEFAFPEQFAAEGGSFVIPLLLPEEVDTGDGRTFKKQSLSFRDLPLPLLWQIKTADGHDGSVVVGRIDHIERLADDATAEFNVDGELVRLSGLGHAYGVFDTGPFGQEAERLVRGKFLRGISADLDKFEANVEGPSADEAAADEEADENVKDKIKNDKMVVTKGRVMAATLVAKPAFQECTITMSDEFTDADLLLEDGIYEDEIEDADVILAALAASAAPVTPPRDWFNNPGLSAATPITVEDDGRIYGHIASWQMYHIGMGGRQVQPPHSSSNYKYFRTGVLRTAEGEDVTVGQLTLAGGHAPLQADASSAVKHYDDTASAVADVTAGEDAFGIWVAGALRPGVTPEQVRVLRASAPSGDWRPINGRLELVAVCQVNVPGFPVARTMVAGGQVTALVAAGARFMAELRDEPVKTLTARVDAIESAELARLKQAAASRITPLAQRNHESLVAAAMAARSRLQPAVDRRAELTETANSARERVLALKLAPQRIFDEDKHPRDTEGKFRRIIAHLGDILTGIDGADEATHKIESAATQEESGHGEAAQNSAREAKARLSELEENVTDPATIQRLKDAQKEIDSAIMGEDLEPEVAPEAPAEDAPAPASPSGGGIVDGIADNMNAPLPPMLARLMSWLLNQIVAKVDPTQAIRNAPEEIRRQLDGKEFQDTAELASYIQELIRRAVSPI